MFLCHSPRTNLVNMGEAWRANQQVLSVIYAKDAELTDILNGSGRKRSLTVVITTVVLLKMRHLFVKTVPFGFDLNMHFAACHRETCSYTCFFDFTKKWPMIK